MLVHITLPRDLMKLYRAGDRTPLGGLLEHLRYTYGLTNVNMDRVDFVGIATGEMSEENFAALRASKLVPVSADSHKNIQKGSSDDPLPPT